MKYLSIVSILFLIACDGGERAKTADEANSIKFRYVEYTCLGGVKYWIHGTKLAPAFNPETSKVIPCKE